MTWDLCVWGTPTRLESQEVRLLSPFSHYGHLVHGPIRTSALLNAIKVFSFTTPATSVLGYTGPVTLFTWATGAAASWLPWPLPCCWELSLS